MRNAISVIPLLMVLACGGKVEVAEGTAVDASAPEDASVQEDTFVPPEVCPWYDCFGFDDTGIVTGAAVKGCDDTECIIKQHMTDCCGTMTWYSVTQSKEAKFDTCEATWRAHIGQCNCKSNGFWTEFPRQPVSDISLVRAYCADLPAGSRCMTGPK
ncbi:MAG: hypothetical protein HY898_09275 [Deltaproteobacteria bacterium]|nr:hypothetical protein [Deltaproteobacteria bacterium]